MEGYRKLLMLSLQETLGDVKGKCVLDLGCGTGRICHLLASLGATKVVGVDKSKEMINAARRMAKPNMQFLTHDCCNLPALGQFDMITAVSLAHYCDSYESMQGLLHGIYDNLKPGGVLVKITPSLENYPDKGKAKIQEVFFEWCKESCANFAKFTTEVQSSSAAYIFDAFNIKSCTWIEEFERTGFTDVHVDDTLARYVMNGRKETLQPELLEVVQTWNWYNTYTAMRPDYAAFDQLGTTYSM